MNEIVGKKRADYSRSKNGNPKEKQTFTMSNGYHQYQSRDSRLKVRELLMQEWDPIGVRGCEEARDEYDRYADRLYVMLMDEQATQERIAAYLMNVVTQSMGLSLHPKLMEDSRRTAEILIGLRPQFEMHGGNSDEAMEKDKK